MQLEALREYAAHRKLDVVAELVDHGVSGARDQRPALDELMASARRRQIDVVLVYRFDRFARSVRHLVTALDEFQPDVVVLALDDETVAHLGWPLPRHHYARLIDAVAAARPASLTFDVALVDGSAEHPDWDAAIAYITARPEIDRTRLAVWGSSFGGGHAITVASRHPELRAAVAQCPFTDGVASAKVLGPLASMKLMPVVARDLVAQALGRPPVTIALAGPPGTRALMTAHDALPGYEALVPENGVFVNEAAARVVPTITRYRPGRAAKRVKMPILFCVSNTDTVTPPSQTIRYASTAPLGESKRYDAGHFDFYLGEPFEALVADQLEFLTRHLGVGADADVDPELEP